MCIYVMQSSTLYEQLLMIHIVRDIIILLSLRVSFENQKESVHLTTWWLLLTSEGTGCENE